MLFETKFNYARANVRNLCSSVLHNHFQGQNISIQFQEHPVRDNKGMILHCEELMTVTLSINKSMVIDLRGNTKTVTHEVDGVMIFTLMLSEIKTSIYQIRAGDAPKAGIEISIIECSGPENYEPELLMEKLNKAIGKYWWEYQLTDNHKKLIELIAYSESDDEDYAPRRRPLAVQWTDSGDICFGVAGKEKFRTVLEEDGTFYLVINTGDAEYNQKGFKTLGEAKNAAQQHIIKQQ